MQRAATVKRKVTLFGREFAKHPFLLRDIPCLPTPVSPTPVLSTSDQKVVFRLLLKILKSRLARMNSGSVKYFRSAPSVPVSLFLSLSLSLSVPRK